MFLVTEQARAYSHKLPIAEGVLPGFPISQHCLLGSEATAKGCEGHSEHGHSRAKDLVSKV